MVDSAGDESESATRQSLYGYQFKIYLIACHRILLCHLLRANLEVAFEQQVNEIDHYYEYC